MAFRQGLSGNKVDQVRATFRQWLCASVVINHRLTKFVQPMITCKGHGAHCLEAAGRFGAVKCGSQIALTSVHLTSVDLIRYTGVHFVGSRPRY